MIKFLIADKRLRDAGFDKACDEIVFQLGQCKKNEALRKTLEAMEFDHRYTKPIDINGMDIAEILIDCDKVITLDTYTQNWWKWKKNPVNAYVTSSAKNKIFFNTRQLPRRSIKSWKETIWHEVTHFADSLSTLSFGHRLVDVPNDPTANSLNGKKNSAPVKWADFMASLKFTGGAL